MKISTYLTFITHLLILFFFFLMSDEKTETGRGQGIVPRSWTWDMEKLEFKLGDFK